MAVFVSAGTAFGAGSTLIGNGKLTSTLDANGQTISNAAIINSGSNELRVQGEGTTLIDLLDGTKIGFFGNAPVVQQTGDIGAGLTALGLFDSTTSMAASSISGASRGVADADTTATTTDYLIAYTSLSVSRTVSLPSAASVAGHTLIVKDESGSVTGSKTINLAPNAIGETIDGASAKQISVAYGLIKLYSTGSKWYTLNTVASAGTGGTVTSVSADGGSTGFSLDVTNATTTPSITMSGIANTTHGGTGLTAYTLGDLIYGSGTNALSVLAGNTSATAKFLRQQGNGTISSAPAWSQIAFSNLTGNISIPQMDNATGATSTAYWGGDGHWHELTTGGSGTVTDGVINWPGTIFATPTDGDVASGMLTFAPSLATQGANTFFGNPTGSTAAPVFATAAQVRTSLNIGSVANGGTGGTTFTVNELIASGTTSTGAFQQIAYGTSGYVLTSNGAGVLPTFQAPTGSGGGLTGGTITWGGSALYTSPTTGVVTGSSIDFAPALAAQSANTFFANGTSGTATPTFISAATARTALGGTTLGQNLFTATNNASGSAVFARINSDNSITLRSGSNVRSDLSLGAANSPTFNGLTLTTALGVASGGTSLTGINLGDTIAGNTGTVFSAIAGNTTTTKKFYSQTGDGTISALPAWSQVTGSDLLLSDVTTNNVSTSAHGFAPKGDGVSTHYLDGTGAYSAISGGTGDVVGPGSATDNAIARFDTTTGKLIQNSGITIADGASGALSGTNTGDQTITLTGGVTGSGTGSFAATVVTNANLTGPITSSGNATTVADPELAALAGVTSANDKLFYFTGSGTGTTINFNSATRTAIAALSGTNTGDQTITLSGDVSGSGTGAITTAIGTGKVTDAMSALSVKPAALAVADSNLTLSGEQTIDGQTTSGSTVLLTAQTTGSQNGPWVTAAGAWSRPTWYTSGSTTQAPRFCTVFIRLGTTYGGTTWRMTTASVTIDTTAQTWVEAPLALNASSVTGTLPVAQLPALTGGDATTSAASGTITLNTVNSNTGTFGDSTHYVSFTTNGKGLITAASQTVWPTFNQSTTGNAATATALQNARTIGGTSFDGTANIVPATTTVINSLSSTTTYVPILSAATGNLQLNTNGSLTFNTSTGVLTATGFAGALTGNATTATTLATARNIGGTSFNGSADIVPATVTVVDSTDATSSIAMFDSATGDMQVKTDGGLTYNASTGMLTATGFTGPLTGNSSTATALATGRTIAMTGDVAWTSASFDGTGNVTGTSTIGSGVVTLAKMANMNTDSIIGRATASSGAPEVLTALPFADTGDATRAADSTVTVVANVPVTATHAKSTTVVPTNTGGWVEYRLSADQTITSSQADIAGLVTDALTSDGVYEIEAVIWATPGANANGVKIAFAANGSSGTPTLHAILVGTSTAAATQSATMNTQGTASAALLSASGITGILQAKGFMTARTTSPTFSVQLQNPTSGAGTAKAGSVFRIRKAF